MSDRAAIKSFLAERDAPCIRCKYNLRGAVGAACPECGWEIDLQLLTEPPRLELGRWFWIGVAADVSVVGISAYRFSGGSAMGVVSTLVVSSVFTLLFVLVAFLRRDRQDVETFASELAWSVWIPLFIKGTCLGGVLLGGAGS